MLNVGVDIGGTKIAAGVVDETGRIIDRVRVDTPADPVELLDAVVDIVEHFRRVHEVDGIGVAAAGFVDGARGVVVHAPNIAWRDEPLGDRLEERLGAQVTIENDANAAGWAEFRFGGGVGATDMVMITLGTGVGGAIVTAGVLSRGGHGLGAELGHVRYERDGRECGCGQRGCLEQYASGRALQREAHAIADEGGRGAHLARVRAENGDIPGDAISRLVLAGDPGAIEALHRVATALGETCGGFQAILDPQLFVIGGGVAQLGEDLLAPLRTAYSTSIPGSSERPLAEFAVARLGNEAGFIGVADLARTGRDQHLPTH